MLHRSLLIRQLNSFPPSFYHSTLSMRRCYDYDGLQSQRLELIFRTSLHDQRDEASLRVMTVLELSPWASTGCLVAMYER